MALLVFYTFTNVTNKSFFNPYLQGSTIKLLVKVLDIQLSKAKECKLCADIQEQFKPRVK
jgi:hypothetical protein